jgi:hypothetical protein
MRTAQVIFLMAGSTTSINDSHLFAESFPFAGAGSGSAKKTYAKCPIPAHAGFSLSHCGKAFLRYLFSAFLGA